MHGFGECYSQKLKKDQCSEFFKLAVGIDHLRFPEDSSKPCMSRKEARINECLEFGSSLLSAT